MDKGRCTIVLNSTGYDAKMLNFLDDTNTYEKLKGEPNSSYEKSSIEVRQKLEKEQAIDRPQYYQLYLGEAIPCIYGMPRIHKQGIPLGPMVGSINSAIYNISKYLASSLAPMVGNAPPPYKTLGTPRTLLKR